MQRYGCRRWHWALFIAAASACGDGGSESPAGELTHRAQRAHVLRFPDSLQTAGFWRVYSGFFRGPESAEALIGHAGGAEILRFGSEGGLESSFGRRGSGPGEFEDLVWIAPLGRDSLVTFDRGPSRISVFSNDGGLGRVESFRPRDGLRQVQRFLAGRDGNVVMAITEALDPGRMGDQPVQDTLTVLRRSFSLGDTVWHEIGRVPGRWWVGGRTPEGALSLTAVPNRDGALIAVLADGRVVFSSEDPAGLFILGGGGDFDPCGSTPNRRPRERAGRST